MGLLIAADLGALGSAAAELAGAVGAGRGGPAAIPSVGDGMAEGALGDFAAAMDRHAAALAGAVSKGDSAMTGYVVGFHEAGG